VTLMEFTGGRKGPDKAPDPLGKPALQTKTGAPEAQKKPEKKEREPAVPTEEGESEEEEEGDEETSPPEKKLSRLEVKSKFPIAIPALAVKDRLGKVTIETVVVTTLQALNDNGFYRPAGGELVVAQAIFQAKKFEFESNDSWKAELQARAAIIQAIADLNRTPARFASANTWSLPVDSWTPVKIVGSGKVQGAFIPKKDVSAAQAIQAIFGAEKPCLLDCSSAIMIAFYRGLLQAVGEDTFNRRKDPLVICPTGVEKVTLTQGDISVPFYAKEVESVTLTSVADLIPGDWVYFLNFPTYETSHAKTAAWAGEHMIYAGNERYVGFGIEGALTAEEVQKELINAYNRDLLAGKAECTEPIKSDKSLTGTWPGLDKGQVQRFKNSASREVLK
jgi:protein-glutamine gamma-glutamyltransferase